MRQNSRLFRLSASAAIGALLCNATLPMAWAQPAPPPPTAQVVPPEQNQADPPDRVGRIASESGAVSFRTSADTQWSAAASNYPVSSGNAFWTEPSARAELEISASRVDMSGQTEFDVTTLDAGGLQAVIPQGEVYLHLTDLAPNEAWSVQTPRGIVRLTSPGRYGILSGTTEQPTLITVMEGAATVTGPGLSLTVAANQTATVEGNGPFQGTIGPEVRDAFLAARLAAERPPAQTPPPVAARLPYMPDIGDLSGAGEWGEAPDYGDVWYPPVAPGWVPYQNGQWAYVAPWGWTWIDAAPWGFVPFHYGRWAHIGSRWGWLPGEAHIAERPVYAPALVAFIGFAAGAAVGAAIAHGSIGWVPLGPGEAYHPWYHASEGYVRQINTIGVRDPAAINHPVAMHEFVNRNGATEVPAAVMLDSRPVRAAARPVSATTFAAAHPVIGEQPIAPTSATLGITPAVAHQLNLADGVAPRRAAPGPVVRAEAPANGLPGLVGPGGMPRAGLPEPGGAREPGGPLPLVVPGGRPAGLPEAQGVIPPSAPRPEGRPPGEPEVARPPGAPPLQAPGARPEGIREPHEGRPPEVPANEPHPAPHPPSEPAEGHAPIGPLPTVERPIHEPPAARAPEIREAPPHEAPVPPHAPPPRLEAPRLEAPRLEAPRPAAPPPHAEPPRPPPPRPEPPPQRRPDQR
jgi:hypothetical protein